EKEIEELNPEIVENLVKRELKNVVLSMLLTRPMSGTDLVKLLYSKFKVFVSPGMLYPTLHELEKKGLLKYEYKLKNKVYSVHEKEQAELLLKKHVKVNSLLSEFLVSK
ncbi:MAG: PadR family transcriptional regulator, partial [Nanoarchaeota archaeon]